jgi:hypothetical protein
MSEKFGGNSGPEGKKEKLKDPLDIEFDSFISGVEADPKDSKERRMAIARNKLIRINAGLQSFEWGKKEYPDIKGGTTLEALEAFLRREKERIEKEIIDNGGKP